MAKKTLDLFNPEFEAQTVGAGMLDAGITAVCAALQPEHFHNRLYGAIWRGEREMFQAGEYCDPVTLADWLQGHGVDVSTGRLLGLMNDCVSSAHAEAYASKVREFAHRRQSEKLAQRLVQTVYSSNGSYGDDLAELAQQVTTHAARLRPPEVVDSEPVSWAALPELLGPIVWEWQDWLVKGMLHILAASSGVGKSNLATRLAGTYALGWPWPDGTRYTGELGKTLWLESESGQWLNYTRAQNWSIPLDSLISAFDDLLAEVNLLDAGHRAAIAARASRPEVKFIVMDSLSGATGGREGSEFQQPVVAFLAELARNTGKPVLCLHHLRKRGQFDLGDVVTLDRVRGHGVIVQPARVVWALDAPNPDEPDHKRLHTIKSNLGRFAQPIGLRIEDTGLIFDAVAPEPPRPDSPVNRAVDLLRSLLASGPMAARQIEEEAAGAGISMNSMKQAKEALNILAIRKGGRYDAHWLWSLPAVQVAEQA